MAKSKLARELPPDSQYLDALKTSMEATGFVLESTLDQMLKDAGWEVISNRYYEDDITSTPREIDLLAYRSKLTNIVRYYYVLIVSCKRSVEDNWVFFTKEEPKVGLNSVRHPTLAWSNDKILQHFIDEGRFGSELTELIDRDAVLAEINNVDRNVFAFQQADQSSATKHNDRDIFASLTSVIKAAEYEIRSLPKRKQEPCFYYFDLLSVFDGRMYEYFCGKSSEVSEVFGAKYKNRYIVGGSDRFYRVNFTSFSKIDSVLALYTGSRDTLFAFTEGLREKFYKEWKEVPKYQNLYLEEVKSAIDHFLRSESRNNSESVAQLMKVTYNRESKTVELEIDSYEDSLFDHLNAQGILMKISKAVIGKLYRFDGDVKFTMHIPF